MTKKLLIFCVNCAGNRVLSSDFKQVFEYLSSTVYKILSYNFSKNLNRSGDPEDVFGGYLE